MTANKRLSNVLQRTHACSQVSRHSRHQLARATGAGLLSDTVSSDHLESWAVGGTTDEAMRVSCQAADVFVK